MRSQKYEPEHTNVAWFIPMPVILTRALFIVTKLENAAFRIFCVLWFIFAWLHFKIIPKHTIGLETYFVVHGQKWTHLFWCTGSAMCQELAHIILLICHSIERSLSPMCSGRFCFIHACMHAHLSSKRKTLVPYQDCRDRIFAQPNQSRWRKIKVAQAKVLRTHTGKLRHLPVRLPHGIRPLFAAFFIVWKPINGGDCKQTRNAHQRAAQY